MQNRFLLTIGLCLIIFGFFKPNFNVIPIIKPNCPTVESYVIDPPSDSILLEKSKVVIDILKQSDDSTKKMDCLKLSSLYSDMALLISLDNKDMVIKDTASIRAANSLSGTMLRLNIKDKYPNLAVAGMDVVVSAIGDDDILLDANTREKASEAFRALSWAFYEGSK